MSEADRAQYAETVTAVSANELERLLNLAASPSIRQYLIENHA